MIIPEFVKKFLEQNIKYVEEADWTMFFQNWYSYGDDYYIDELFECLEHAGINVREESYETRKDILTRKCTYAFQQLMMETNRITIGRLVNELNSTLNLDENDLGKVYNAAAEAHGLHKATNGWFVL